MIPARAHDSMFARLLSLQPRPFIAGLARLAPQVAPLPPCGGRSTLSSLPAPGLRHQSTFAAAALKGGPDCLLNVPGIGARTADLLVQKDVVSIPALCSLYEMELNSDKEALLSFLVVRSSHHHFAQQTGTIGTLN